MTAGAGTSGPSSRGHVVAWGMWNAGAAAYHSVVLTFVFSVYLTGAVGRGLPGPVTAEAWLGYALGAAGLVIAVTAPVVGQRADATGRRKRATLGWTAATVTSMAALVTVRPDWHWLAPGLVLLGLGSIFAELASVPYNAMLGQVSTPATMGRVSGLGWAMGYAGGAALLPVVYFGLIAGGGGLVGAPTADGFNVRLAAPVAAAWFVALAVPMFVTLPESVPTAVGTARLGGVGADRALARALRGGRAALDEHLPPARARGAPPGGPRPPPRSARTGSGCSGPTGSWLEISGSSARTTRPHWCSSARARSTATASPRSPPSPRCWP